MLKGRAPALRLLYQRKWCRFWLKEVSARTTSSTSSGSTRKSASDVGATKDTSDGVGAVPDVSTKLKARLPLAKNFFVGVVDKELLAYPEVVTRDDMSQLHNELLPTRNFFSEEVDAKAIDAQRAIPSPICENIRQLGLYGINVPRDYEGGKGWGWSESLIASEHESKSTDISLALLSHRVVVDVLKEIGTAEQQTHFLSQLASGAAVATEAIFEHDVAEEDFFNTNAQIVPESGKWSINGEKAFVVCGPLPQGSTLLFLVIAQTQRPNVQGQIASGSTIFLVKSGTQGVELGDKHATTGCRGVEMRRVKFNNVQVPDSCILGLPYEGNKVADVLLRSSRLRNSIIGLGMAKNLVNELAEYCVNSKQCGVVLKDMQMVQMHLSRATCATYAMESMLYLTAGLLDEFQGQDVALEASITKYYTLTELLKIASIALEMIGPRSLHSGQPTEISYRNASQLLTQGESIDTLRLYIAFTGLQHSGALMNDNVQKARNPMFHPGYIFSKFLQTSNIDQPKTKMRLGEHVHPSLEPAAQCIEHSVARLQMCVELLLTRFGSGIVERHSDMVRLTEIVTSIYAMFASVSRASRSYCIGLQLADYEMLMASSICIQGRDRVKMLSTEIFDGQFVNSDNNLHRLAKQVAQSKGYFAVHPLSYNF